jgi:hypothetical protein
MHDSVTEIRFQSLAMLVREFEAAALPASQWYHGTHLAVAFWYARSYPLPEAESKLRDGIRRLNVALGGKNTEDAGYHETLTLFWLRAVRTFIKDSAGAPDEMLERLVEAYGERRDLWRDYYSFDVVRSREARARWVPPDLRPLE